MFGLTYTTFFVINTRRCLFHFFAQLGKELERLEVLKRQNLKRFIEATRTELDKVWTKCHYGEEQKREFVPAFTG